MWEIITCLELMILCANFVLYSEDAFTYMVYVAVSSLSVCNLHSFIVLLVAAY